jgi:hypothetical protein
MNEYRRLANEFGAMISETRQTAQELMKCVTQSRTLVTESELLLTQSRAFTTSLHVRRLNRALAAHLFHQGCARTG